ncbi:RNA polymerase sigma-70 factor [Joostella atrarenae]|uniref:RNA polymerase sigma-70 factor n=1 Tax=Joostella atrarenae TaxID=679257 RepID=A0ABS9J4L8_9FLAO|nr:RNA polymerase sigma-70 factor [Joostella atrarenae]MCF8715375.1 RNA polymerase sigma-70 factor [Joostella atrarenae]
MGTTSINNSFFIQQLKKGKETAYEALFNLYFKKLHYFSCQYINNDEDANEIVQNTFYKLWKKRHKLSTDINLNAYLFAIVKNECLDYLKHQKIKSQYKNQIESEINLINQESLQDNPSLLLIEKELHNKVNQLIEQLPPACKDIFIKSRFNGLKHKEIAEELSISQKTVEAQITKALKFLRHELQEYMGFFL